MDASTSPMSANRSTNAGCAWFRFSPSGGSRHYQRIIRSPGERTCPPRTWPVSPTYATSRPLPCLASRAPQRRLRSVEEKLEHVAAGHGIIVLPLSATQYYKRTDVVYVHIVDAELDQVYLASEATRRSRLITGFIRAAQHALPSSETASARRVTGTAGT